MEIFTTNTQNLLSIKEASKWASNYLRREISETNISYLIQYGKVRKITDNGVVFVSLEELKSYYDSFHGKREIKWKDRLGHDLNWHLSFDYLREKDTTKHVHRLHPYKGKFIPQLVQYFLDNHTDEFKQNIYFNPGDIVLDPFCGSGTTLVQANELGMHAIGIDISSFNSLISNVKVREYDLKNLTIIINEITKKFKNFISISNITEFENKLLEELADFNNQNFPSPEFKYKVNKKEIEEIEYSLEKEKSFLTIYNKLINEFGIELNQDKEDNFLDRWYLKPVRKEIDFLFNEIKQIKDSHLKKILTIILSRTIRSCRATTHSDLATLKNPVNSTYYCRKHKKICKPLFSMYKWWLKYTKDTIFRLSQFKKIKTETFQLCFTEDSRTINISQKLKIHKPELYKIYDKQKIKGIFTSPPYVGLIDYHEQHAYSYELFGFQRKDNLEIGPLSKGSGEKARQEYIQGIAEVFINCKKYLSDDFNIFIVANDKFNLYPKIAENSNLKIVNKYKRPVLNRTEKDKSAYSEIIFHLKNI